jgi:hypothetical protein
LGPIHNIGSDSSSTINLQASTGDELRLVASEEETVVGNIGRMRKTAKRDVAEEFLEILFGRGNAYEGFESGSS